MLSSRMTTDPNEPSQGISQVSFEDYVGMSACVPVFGFEGMLAHYKLSAAQWAQIAGQWNAVIPTDPRYASYGVLVQQETARVRAGGPPRAVTFGAGAPPAAYAQAPAYGVASPWGAPPPPRPPQAYAPQAADIGAQIGSAFNAFGNALGSFVDSAVSGIGVGSRVAVQWSDGNRYPGTVVAVQSGLVQVAFPNGQHVWVPQAYVTLV